MGAASLRGMLAAAKQDQVLRWHLTSNHYPPLDNPQDFAIAKRAIGLGREERNEPVIVTIIDCDYDFADYQKITGREMTEEEKASPVFLEDGEGNKVKSYDILDAWHLWDFLSEDEEDEDGP